MKKLIWGLFFIFFFHQIIFSLPRFSLKLGDRCIDCHVNPTGGIMRKENGFFFGKNVLSMISIKDKVFPISNKVSENISFGFDHRNQILYSQEKNRSDFHHMSGSIYLNTSLSNKIDILTRYDFVQLICEAYAIARILPNDSYVKIGTFTPNFGIRIDDHTSYTRGGDFGLLFSLNKIQGLIYNPFYTETGIEFGVYLNDFIFFTASAGKSKSNPLLSSDPSFTSRIEFTQSIKEFNFLFGGSFASVKTNLTGKTLNTYLYGGFFGFGSKYFSFLSEFDLANNYITHNSKSSSFLLEITYQLMIGLDIIARFDNFIPNLSAKDDDYSHLIFGFEFFPFSFIEIRPQYRINLENPGKSNNAFVLHFHLWY